VLTLIGIACSTWVCLSHKYFQFESVRNDTFFDEDKSQPEPFEYATKANVGIFRYEILEVYEYPWPPAKQERQLAEDMLLAEVQRLLQTSPPSTDLNATDLNATAADLNATAADLNATVADLNATQAPNSTAPTASPLANETSVPSNATNNGTDPFVPGVLPGSNEMGSLSPTSTPTSSPTVTNPNDIVAESVDIGEVKKYPEGMDQFDSLFGNAQMGAMVAPILAGVGTIFGLVELCCCTYKCSWLPTALFIYLAFMLQMMTLFLFLSEDFW
jgi:cytoskeletal protein RodZ